jgi:hypothetical protein
MSSIMRDRAVIGQMVDRFLRVHLPKNREKGLQGMIRCASRGQSETPDDEQIRIIVDEIARRDERQKVVVATMDSDNAHKQIDDFASRGRGDILLVKGMGGVGLDFPNVKTVMDLSTQRSVASEVQFMLRAGMPGSARVFDFIFPDDVLARTIVSMVTDGGRLEAKEMVTESEEKTETVTLEEADSRERAEYVAGAARFGSSNDHDDNIATPAEMELAIAFSRSFPELRTTLTLQGIATKIRSDPAMRAVAEKLSEQDVQGPVGKARAMADMSPGLLRAELQGKAKRIVAARGTRYVSREENEGRFSLWKAELGTVWRQAYALAGVERPKSRKAKIDALTDDEVTRLHTALVELLGRAQSAALDARC